MGLSTGETSSTNMLDAEKAVFDFINNNDLNGLKSYMSAHRMSPNFYDEHGMCPLTQACFKGNREISQFLIDQGADVNNDRHGSGYTPLHFAALSGNASLCELLLSANAKRDPVNSIGRTPSQMAGFVGKHQCAAVINNYIPRSEVDAFTVAKDGCKPTLPSTLASAVHKLIIHVNLHPVRVAMSCSPIIDDVASVCNVLDSMCDKHMLLGHEVMAFKLHYLAFVIREISKFKVPDKTTVNIEAFCKRIIKDDAYLEAVLKESIKTFPFKVTPIFHQMMTSLAGPLVDDPPPAFNVITNVVNGARGFIDEIKTCVVCFEETDTKKCSKCKMTQYCSRDCQKLHWFMHKKTCCQD